MTTQSNKSIMQRLWNEIFNQGNTKVADEIVGVNYLNHNPAPGEQPGRVGLVGFVAYLRAGFPDVHFDVEELLADGDKVTTRWRCRGTHRGEFMGIPATGRAVNVSGMAIHRIADGQLVEGWNNWDALGLLQQLGAASQPAQGA